MKITGINHVGLAPKDPARARWFFHEVLGLPVRGEELVAEQKTNTVILPAGSADGGDGELLEILEDTGTAENPGPVARFLEKKGAGIHHLALTVDSIEDAIRHLQKKEIRLVDESPRPGVCETRVIFVHPSATGGLLVELVENPPGGA